jgi:uncharacterized membrane protein YtjA (UPF0391 family)
LIYAPSRARAGENRTFTVWNYATAFLSIAVTAEAVGLGGIPAQAVEIENIVFIVLLLAFIAVAVRKFMRK